MKIKKIKQNAFTIPELLIFLTIVGIVSVMMMTIIRPGEKYLPYAYYSAYNALSEAAFNIKEDANINNMTEDDTISEDDKYFPGAVKNTGSEALPAARELCKKLANKPNATDAEDEYGYINTTEYACTTFTSFDSNGNFDSNATPAFRATNSMKFYIGKLAKVDVPNALESDTNYEIKYFVVWVDLNGDRRPNIAEWDKNKSTDIVPFVITTSGNVIPIGGPTIDTRYTTVRLRYPTEESSLRFSLNSTTFLEGQIAAYNGKEFPSYDQLSIRDSLYNVFKNNTAYKNTSDTITLIKSKAKLDDKCEFTAGNIPPCTISIDENSRL